MSWRCGRVGQEAGSPWHCTMLGGQAVEASVTEGATGQGTVTPRRAPGRCLDAATEPFLHRILPHPLLGKFGTTIAGKEDCCGQ
jgi:hypothetical protein